MPLDHPHSFQTLLPISLNLLSFFHQSPSSLSASSFFFKRSFTSVPSTRRINEAGGKKKPMVTKATEPCNAVNLCGGVGFWPDLRGGEARWLDRGFALVPNSRCRQINAVGGSWHGSHFRAVKCCWAFNFRSHHIKAVDSVLIIHLKELVT
ncbi:hypothetical protein AKJ16_DCAP15589 [Drosera capensis]